MFQDWYDIKEQGNVSQGDILFNLPLFIPEYPNDSQQNGTIRCSKYEADVIVLTQACDLEIRGGKECPEITSVLVAAISNARKDKITKSIMKEVSKLKRPNLFLIEPSCQDIMMDYQIVHFDSLYTIPWIYLNRFCVAKKKRLHLKSPFMELLSHHFGNYFSRVAIPEDRAPSLDEYFKMQEEYIKNNGNSWCDLSWQEAISYLEEPKK